MITVEEQLADARLRIKRLERSQVRMGSGTIITADTANQRADVTLPDGTVIHNVQVIGNYIPEAGQPVHFWLNGLQPIVYPPTQPITSAPPAQVGGVTATPGTGSLIVRWAALTEADVKWNRGYYQVQVDTVNTFNSGNLKVQDSPGTVSVITDLTPGTLYYVRVRGVDYVGQVGTYSATVSATPGSSAIAPGSITATEIADNAITSPKIAANTIQAGDIAANTITGAEIAANAIDTSELNANAVTAAKLAALNIEVGKYIRSTTYVPGLSGWTINADGTAELSDVIVRGTIAASEIIGSQIVGVLAPSMIPNPSADTNTTGWTATNCTLARTTTAGRFRSAPAAFQLTATTIGDTYIETPTGTSGFVVTPGLSYSATAFFKALTTTRNTQMHIRFYNSSGTLLGSSIIATADDMTNAWRGNQVTATCPTGGVYASVRCLVQANVAGEVHMIDDIAFQATSSVNSDLQTGVPGGPSVDIYSDAFPQIILFQGVDGEDVAQIYRTTYKNGQALDGTTLTLYSGNPPAGAASFLQLDSAGISSGRNRLIRFNTDRLYLDTGSSGQLPVYSHSTDNQILGGGVMSTTSTLPAEPATPLRITFTKRYTESYILATLWGNYLYVSTGFGDRIQLYVYDGTNFTLIANGFSPNSTGFGASLFGQRHILGGAPAGTYTFQWRWNTGGGQTLNFDTNSSIGMSIKEIGLT